MRQFFRHEGGYVGALHRCGYVGILLLGNAVKPHIRGEGFLLIAAHALEQFLGLLHVHRHPQARQQARYVRFLAVQRQGYADLPSSGQGRQGIKGFRFLLVIRRFHRNDRQAIVALLQHAPLLLGIGLHGISDEIFHPNHKGCAIAVQADGIHAHFVQLIQPCQTHAHVPACPQCFAIAVRYVAAVLVQFGFRADAQQHFVRFLIPAQGRGKGTFLLIRGCEHNAPKDAVGYSQGVLGIQHHGHFPLIPTHHRLFNRP